MKKRVLMVGLILSVVAGSAIAEAAASGRGPSERAHGPSVGVNAGSPVGANAGSRAGSTGKSRAEGRARSRSGGKARSRRCAKPRSVGFVVKGTFVSGDATSVTLSVLKANRHALKSGLVSVGDNFTATVAKAARIRYLNRSGPGDAQVTDKVRAVGKVTKQRHGCSSDGFTAEAKIRKVMVIGPEPAEDVDQSDADDGAGAGDAGDSADE